MILTDATEANAYFVAQHMRAADRAEIYATAAIEDDADLAANVARRGPHAWCAGVDRPIACFGMAPCWPGVFQAWMFATDEFPRVALPLTRWLRCNMMRILRTASARRMHAYSMESHTIAHKWMLALGARREATHPNFGKNGETFHVFAWNLA